MDDCSEASGSRWRWSMAAAVIVWSTIGCASIVDRPMTDEQQQAYDIALGRLLQAHAYEMRCPALEPLIEEMLWDKGYGDDEIESASGAVGLRTTWRDREPGGSVRYEFHLRDVGVDDCAVEVLARRRSNGDESMRDVDMEMRLLESIDDPEAERLRSKARDEAEQRSQSP